MKVAAEIRLKHGILRETVERLGSIKAVAESFGMGYQTVCSWVTMTRCPVPGKYNRFYTPEVERKIEEITGHDIDEVFPPELQSATEYFRKSERVHVSVKDVSPGVLLTMAQGAEQRLISSDPHDDAIRSELKDRVDSLLQKAKEMSERAKIVIRLRFGLDGDPPLTLKETGKVLGVGMERVRQIEGKALRQLQMSHRIKELVGFLDEKSPDWKKIDEERRELESMTLKERLET